MEPFCEVLPKSESCIFFFKQGNLLLKYFRFSSIYRSLIKSNQIGEIDHVNSSLYTVRCSSKAQELLFEEFMNVEFMQLDSMIKFMFIFNSNCFD